MRNFLFTFLLLVCFTNFNAADDGMVCVNPEHIVRIGIDRTADATTVIDESGREHLVPIVPISYILQDSAAFPLLYVFGSVEQIKKCLEGKKTSCMRQDLLYDDIKE